MKYPHICYFCCNQIFFEASGSLSSHGRSGRFGAAHPAGAVARAKSTASAACSEGWRIQRENMVAAWDFVNNGDVIRKNKMQPTNPNAHTYVHGTDVETHGYAVTQNTFLQKFF